MKSNTGTVVASWHPRRRATIDENAKKIQTFDKFCDVMLLRFFILQLVCIIMILFMQILKQNDKVLKEIYHRRISEKSVKFRVEFWKFPK